MNGRPPGLLFTLTPNTAVDEVWDVPSLRVPGITQAGRIVHYPSGKGVNVTRAIAALGAPVTAFGLVGVDDARHFSGLASPLISPRFIEVPGSSRHNITLHDETRREETHIKGISFRAGPEAMARLAEQVAAAVRPGDIVAMSGSLPPGSPSSFYCELIARLNNAGVRTFLDSSGEALRQGVDARPFLIKPNEEEYQQLTGLRAGEPDGAVLAAARELAVRGIAWVVVSRAERGVIAVDGATGEAWKGWVELEAGALTRSGVGCGDALIAGLAVRLAQGAPFSACLRLGIACGTASLYRPGPGEFDPASAHQLADRVKLVRLDGE